MTSFSKYVASDKTQSGRNLNFDIFEFDTNLNFRAALSILPII
ncbi:hypothetical protein Javan178_0003 [Streptococcus phage Javan178]|nr:hypothetical protein Javan178_0003 [Streptococcus phage Javan178]